MYKNRRNRQSESTVNRNAKSKETKKNEKNVLTVVNENVELSSSPAKLKRVDIQQQVEIHDNDDFLMSQASIPASQPPTQRRYLSQRSLMIGRTQSKSLAKAPNSYFEMVLMKAGADLSQENTVVLGFDNITFVDRLCKLLNKNQDDIDDNIKNFIEGFRDYLNQTSSQAIKLLTGCCVNSPSTNAQIQSQDSVVVNILLVNQLQKKVIEVLLDKVENLVGQNTTNTDDISLIPLILSQLKLIASAYSDELYTRIVKIYEQISMPAMKKEILMNIEFVLDPSKHDEFVSYLLDNSLNNEELLNESTVQLFANFYLNSNIQKKLRKKIFHYIRDGCEISLIPNFVKFLLAVIPNEDEILSELISELRNCLCLRCTELQDQNKIQLSIFEIISQALIKSRRISDHWQKVIQKMNEDEFKSFDFVIFLMLMSIREEKRNYIENLLRRWIKQERIKIDLITETEQIFKSILDEYRDLLFRILHEFLREKNHLLHNFAKQTYRILFMSGDNCQKKVLMKLIELICDKSVSNTTSITLEILKSLNERYVNEMQNYGLLLLPLLDHISEMNLNQFRTIMEILCSLSYPQSGFEENQILRDHIDMLVKKQIISQISIIKKQGIIGITQLIYYISCTEDNCTKDDNIYNLDNTYDSIDELPDGRGKLAATYITRVFSATSYCIESLALFYNEMAMIFSPRNKGKFHTDRYFLIWLSDLVTNYFQNYFVVEDLPKGFSLDLSFKNCINSSDDNSGTESELIPIAVNIAGLTLKPSAQATSSIIVLSPLFSLMRNLHFIRYEGSLESINAVLGCAVILPKFVENSTGKDLFDDYNDDMVKKILDIYFHLINWYREIIGSFANQNDQMIKKKVLLRLNELIILEESVHNLLKHSAASCYIPPPCQFTTTNNTNLPIFKKPVGKPKVAASKSKPAEKRIANDTETEGMSILATARTQNPNKKVAHKANSGGTGSGLNHFDGIYGPQEKYRQMNFNLMLILRENFVLKISLDTEEIGNCFGLLEFKFILSDLISKLESVTGTKPMISDELFQHVTNPGDLVNDVVHLLPVFIDHFKQLTDSIKKIIEYVNGVMGNADLYTDEFNCIKICHGLCLRLLAAIFSWQNFEDFDTNGKLLTAAIFAVNGLPITEIQNDQTNNLNEIVKTAFKNFIKLENCILDLKSAVYLFDLCSALKKFINDDKSIDNNFQDSIYNLCEKFLHKKWYNHSGAQEKGATCNSWLDKLLEGFFKNFNLKKLQNILKVVLGEINLLQKKDNVLRTFPNIHKLNFPLVFKHLCSTFINILNEDIHKIDTTTINALKMWERSCEILNQLLTIVKSLDLPRNFSLFLKYSHSFLKMFLQHGLIIVEKYLRHNPERINDLLRSLQTTTRFLHNLCCHSKTIKQGAIVAQIPFIRETVENLVFKIKAALAANKCSSVFWMGDLKNKDLHGEVILSQCSSENVDDEEDEDNDDNLPSDDDDDENPDETIMDDRSKTKNNDSHSKHSSI